MNTLINYAQFMGLNIMLILICSGFTTTAYVVYIVWIIGAVIFSLLFWNGLKEIQRGEIDTPMEFQYIPHDLPAINKVIFICSSMIHIVLAYVLLNSFLIPVMMVTLLLIRLKTSNEFQKVLLCQK